MRELLTCISSPIIYLSWCFLYEISSIIYIIFSLLFSLDTYFRFLLLLTIIHHFFPIFFLLSFYAFLLFICLKLTYTFYICAGAVMYSDSECEIEEPCPNSSRIRYIQLPASILGNTMNPSHLMSRTYSCKIVIFKTS